MNLGRHTMPLEDAVNIVHELRTLGQSFWRLGPADLYASTPRRWLQARAGGYESAGEEVTPAAG